MAEIHYWHGFDRLVKGLADYYDSHPNYKVFFHIVGDFFGQREKDDILPIIKQHKLENYVTLHGAKHGEELDRLFEKADMAIGSLARHRSGITHIKTLKNREYAARGLSFIYSETDSDFENKPYILKVPADETAIDINSLIHFYEKQSLSPLEIRESIRSLSWETQMNKAGVPAMRVRTLPEALSDPTLNSGKLIRTFESVEGVDGPVHVPLVPFGLSAVAIGTDLPPPVLGAHTTEVLKEIGYSVPDIENFSNIRVI